MTNASYATTRYNFYVRSANILDLTDPVMAKEWGYKGGEISDFTRQIGASARNAGFDAIRFSSERGSGANIVVLDNFERLLQPQMVVPAPEFNPELEPSYHSNSR